MLLLPAETSIFDTFGGLPLHPLVVHLAVIALPASALLLAAVVLVPRLRARWATPALLGLAVGTVAAFVAKESGEALATHVGVPKDHSFWGDLLPLVAAPTLLLSAVWWFLNRRDASGSSVPKLVAGLLAAALALATTAITVLVGHSGATAVWADKISTTPAATASSATTATTTSGTGTATPSASATSAASSALNLANVARHNTASSCWSAINGNVYDLTAWINQHPGGPDVITGLCGVDGTAAYVAEHKTQREPLAALKTFLLGPLTA